MPSMIAKCICLLAFALSVNGATSPRIARDVSLRRDSSGGRVELPATLGARRLRKRSRKYCELQSTATITSSATPTPSSSPVQVASKVAAQPASTPSSSGGKSSSGNGFLSGTNSGDGTYYGVGLGACGWTNSDSDLIVSVSHFLFDSYPGYDGGNPNANPVCGRNINAHYQGKSVMVRVVDRCTGCDMTSLDFAPAAFNSLADESIGRMHGMTWSWA